MCAYLRIVACQLIGDAGQAVRPDSDRIGALRLGIQQGPAVVNERTCLAGDPVEVSGDLRR